MVLIYTSTIKELFPKACNINYSLKDLKGGEESYYLSNHSILMVA